MSILTIDRNDKRACLLAIALGRYSKGVRGYVMRNAVADRWRTLYLEGYRAVPFGRTFRFISPTGIRLTKVGVKQMGEGEF